MPKFSGLGFRGLRFRFQGLGCFSEMHQYQISNAFHRVLKGVLEA